MKHRIHREFLGDQHYVWCSETFDSRTRGRYSRGARMPPSSDPCAIYRDLRDAVANNDHHCAKIAEQRKNLIALAVKLASENRITEDVRDEISAMVQRAGLTEFAPYLYVIPCATVAARAESVPVNERASLEQEWIIRDLRTTEFDIVEYPI